MKLTVFNGSPRGQKSNTKILLERFLQGFQETPGNSHEIYYLNRIRQAATFQQAFGQAGVALLAFPLYTDAMPGLVKAFIETLGTYCTREHNPAIGFIVQSGFMEATHSRHVEKYLEKLSARLGSRYLGTVIKGGVEGIQVQPPGMTRKLFERFSLLGRAFGQTGRFDEAILRELAQPERLTKPMIVLLTLMGMTGLTNFYWNNQMKANNAFEKRFARPYTE
jgi:NAD(P)H-dependent FMN reductase